MWENVQICKEKLLDKDKVIEKAVKEGYTCILDQNVVMFLYDSYSEDWIKDIREWLLHNYGVNLVKPGVKNLGKEDYAAIRIPFSYGFRKNNSVSILSSGIKEDLEE